MLSILSVLVLYSILGYREGNDLDQIMQALFKAFHSIPHERLIAKIMKMIACVVSNDACVAN